MSFNNPIVTEIHEKIQSLADQRNSLTQKVSELESQLSTMEIQLEERMKSLDALEQKYKVVKLAKSLEGEESTESTKDLKLKINEMVREIDKCIALLNK